MRKSLEAGEDRERERKQRSDRGPLEGSQRAKGTNLDCSSSYTARDSSNEIHSDGFERDNWTSAEIGEDDRSKLEGSIGAAWNLD